MPFARCDGIETHYEIVGAGPPLLMFAPGGFDATAEKWRSLGIYGKTRMLEHLAAQYRCIVFDRREAGRSGGRVERITWASYVAQAKDLLDHLGIARAHLMGGCMGVCPALAFAVAHPQATRALVLFWPVGGAKYRIASHQRFAAHLAFVREQGLAAVAARAAASGKSFGEDPAGGPWAAVIRADPGFAADYARMKSEGYQRILAGTAAALFDRDTAPGAEPEDLLRLDIPALIVPGRDASHATSAARYLEECLPGAEYWDAPPAAQTERPTAERLLGFLATAAEPSE